MRAAIIGVSAIVSFLGLAVSFAEDAAPPAVTDAAPTAKKNGEFALDLYGRLREKEGNVFFSPHSISTALAMTYNGARGRTGEQMASVLHFDKDAARSNAGFSALEKVLAGDGKPRGYELSVANALWRQKGYPFKADFLGTVKKAFGAGVEELDFHDDTEGARKTINEWVERETKQKIKDLIKPGVLDEDVKLVLTNAIAFKGSWAHTFKASQTKEAKFHVAKGRDVATSMMHMDSDDAGGDFSHADSDEAQLLELPYAARSCPWSSSCRRT
jgi:serpin B